MSGRVYAVRAHTPHPPTSGSKQNVQFAKIELKEFVDGAWMKHKGGIAAQRSPNILCSIVDFNAISHWVITQTLLPITPEVR